MNKDRQKRLKLKSEIKVALRLKQNLKIVHNKFFENCMTKQEYKYIYKSEMSRRLAKTQHHSKKN